MTKKKLSQISKSEYIEKKAHGKKQSELHFTFLGNAIIEA